MRQVLESILTRVLDQQKFAEAKNAVLATISGAAGMALLTAYTIRASSIAGAHTRAHLVASAMFLCCSAVAFIAFLPRLRNKIRASGDAHLNGNLVSFEDLKSYTEAALLEEMSKSIPGPTPAGRLETNLANQIIVNSLIVSYKHRCFRLACSFLLAGFVVVLYGIGVEYFAFANLPAKK